MKRFHLLLLLLLFFIACKKEDSGYTSSNIHGFRQADCSNPVGQGVFEDYNDSEKAYLYHGLQDPGILDTSYVTDFGVTSHDVLPNVDNAGAFYFISKKSVRINLWIMFNYEHLQGAGYITTDSLGRKSANFLQLNYIHMSGDARPDPSSGCYRLYYIFSAPVTPGLSDYKIVNKGHFDLNVRI